MVSVRFLFLDSLPVHIASYQILSLCPQGVPDVESVFKSISKTAVIQLEVQ